MKSPLFTVPAREVEAGDKRVSWSVPVDWINEALEGSEATGRGTPGQLSAYLTKNGPEVLVKAQLKAELTMPCARSLEPVDVDIDAEIVLLLAPAPVAPDDQAKNGKGPRRRKRRSEANEDELLSPEIASQDFYSGETIALDEFVREQLLLELPLFPVRSDLPFKPVAATDTPPVEPERKERPVDPRLAPLAALARQMQRSPKE